MKCILMNKNTEVIFSEYNVSLKGFSEIYDVSNIEYAPLIIYNSYKNKDKEKFLIELSEWFKGRGIPDWRDNLDILLSQLNVTAPSELLDKAFGLSLSDQYWLKPVDSDLKYDNINFFDHDFDSVDYTNATFGSTSNLNIKISLHSPNNTTDGRLKKTWIIEKNKRYLLKGAYKNEVMQPFNEVLATMICKRLGFFHVPYTIQVVNGEITSKCACFINKDTELITAYQILHNNCQNKEKAFDEYINILESNGIKDARESVENMFILDYLMLNEDRHLSNFGIIRNVKSLKWESVAPIFDTGQSLNIIDYNDEKMVINGNGRFFYEVGNFEDIFPKINNIKRFDITKLDGLCEEFDKLLHKYTYITHMTDRRINKICTLLNSRINRLKSIIAGQ